MSIVVYLKVVDKINFYQDSLVYKCQFIKHIQLDYMFSESPTQRHFRELAKYKLYLELTHKYLVIKLYKKQTDSNYYSACLLFS